MNNILLAIISFHIILLYFLFKDDVKLPHSNILKPLFLTVISWLLYVGLDLYMTQGAVVQWGTYWSGIFLFSVAYNLVIASLLKGIQSLQFWIPAQLGVAFGIPDFIYLMVTKGYIPEVMSYMPLYMNEAWKLYFNVIGVAILTTLIYFIPLIRNKLKSRGGECDQ